MVLDALSIRSDTLLRLFDAETSAGLTPGAADRGAPRGRADLATAALLVLACAAGALDASAPLWDRFSDRTTLFHWLRLAAGLAFIAAGFVAARRPAGRRIGRLLLATAIVYFLPAVGWSRWALGFTFGLAAWAVWQAIAAHAVVAYPEGWLRGRFERTVVVVIYGWTLVINPLAVAFEDPRDFGCNGCPRNLLLVHGDRSIRELLGRVQGIGTVVLALVVFAVLARRWRGATRPERRVLAPVFIVFGVNVVAVAAAEASDLVASGTLVTVLADIELGALILVPIGLLAGLLMSLVRRSAIGNLVVRIGQSATAEEMERDVAWALGDRSARLAVWHPERAGFFAGGGEPVELPAADSAQAATMIEGSDGQVAALLHDKSISREQPELVEAVAGAARLALENRRLQAEAKLSRSVSSGLVERLRRAGRRIGETETLEVTVLTSDVRGYSTVAERADPHALAGQLHAHRDEMARVITDHAGTVMQFVGDEVFAVFGAPAPIADHAARAVACAREMQAAQTAVNDRWVETGLPRFELGIGLSTGEVAAALLGSEAHTEYSIVGDTVNLSKRLQQWAGPGEIVMSADTFHGAGEPRDAGGLDPARVKGRKALVAAYRLPAPVADGSGPSSPVGVEAFPMR
jgi:class 3 adenylate cyclase